MLGHTIKTYIEKTRLVTLIMFILQNLINIAIAFAYLCVNSISPLGIAFASIATLANIVMIFIVGLNTTTNKKVGDRSSNQAEIDKYNFYADLFLAITIPCVILSVASNFFAMYTTVLVLITALSLTPPGWACLTLALIVAIVTSIAVFQYNTNHTIETWERIKSLSNVSIDGELPVPDEDFQNSLTDDENLESSTALSIAQSQNPSPAHAFDKPSVAYAKLPTAESLPQSPTHIYNLKYIEESQESPNKWYSSKFRHLEVDSNAESGSVTLPRASSEGYNRSKGMRKDIAPFWSPQSHLKRRAITPDPRRASSNSLTDLTVPKKQDGDISMLKFG